jgi:hypothetical protein
VSIDWATVIENLIVRVVEGKRPVEEGSRRELVGVSGSAGCGVVSTCLAASTHPGRFCIWDASGPRGYPR